MAHKFGSVVLVALGPETVNALVVQSVQQNDGEHLTVVYLDPTKESPLLSGQNVDAAIKRDFVVPLTEGKTFGWKDSPLLEYASKIIQAQADKIDGLVKELSETTEGRDKALQALADENNAKQGAPEQLDAVQGGITPGDPESPHAIENGVGSTSDNPLPG